LQELHAVHSPDLESLVHAGAWFIHSGIQETIGGVARYHLLPEGRNLPVSTEITGYACSTFAYLYRLTGEAAYRQAGLRAAYFLAETAWREDLRAMPYELGHPLPPAYFFDCGIVVRGLLAVHRMTGENRWLNRAREVGLFMGRAFRSNGVCHPIISLPLGEPWPYEKRWSREPGCFQLKAAMAWDDLAAYVPADPFLGWYEESLAYALATWETFLPGDADPLRVMDRLHAHCYFLEGLQPRKQRPEVRATLAAAIERTSRYLREIAPQFERSDVCAQLLRVRLYTGEVDLTLAADEAARCRAHQVFGPEPMRDGGFCFGTRDGQPLPYMNPVSTAFCLQALEQWRQYNAGLFPGDGFADAIRELI
jgi:hypothetical protein